MILQNDYKNLGDSGIYVVGLYNKVVKRIICPSCLGVGWEIHQQWKLKCLLCDADGWADAQDCLDYYTNIEPDTIKLKEVKKKIAPSGEEDEEESDDEEEGDGFNIQPSESEGSYMA